MESVIHVSAENLLVHGFRVVYVLDVVRKEEVDEEGTGDEFVRHRIRFAKCFKDSSILECCAQLTHANLSIVCRVRIKLDTPFEVQNVDAFEVGAVQVRRRV